MRQGDLGVQIRLSFKVLQRSTGRRAQPRYSTRIAIFIHHQCLCHFFFRTSVIIKKMQRHPLWSSGGAFDIRASHPPWIREGTLCRSSPHTEAYTGRRQTYRHSYNVSLPEQPTITPWYRVAKGWHTTIPRFRSLGRIQACSALPRLLLTSISPLVALP